MTERELFTAAREIADPAARAAFLAAAGPLKERVEQLLRADAATGGVLDEPAVARPAEMADLYFLAPPGRPDSLGRIGHYEVLEVLGRGGFGIVFRAFDDALQRVVAVKVLAPALAATSPARQRFLREARAAAAVRHEHVVHVYAVEEQPLPFLVMEFIPGETLQQRLDRTGPLAPADAARIGRQVALGLAAAHATGLIHRDVKPANILLDRGPTEAVKLTDFGLARTADDASGLHSGTVAGTPMYMAPEQARGDRLDHRADLFSLGSVLYAMCTGRPPFRAAGTLAVLKRVDEDTPRPIRETIPEVPAWLCAVVARLHAKNPADRYPTAAAVADDLARGRADAPPRRRRSRRAVAVAAGVLLVAGLGFAEATGATAVGGSVLRLFSPDGTLVVETDDPDLVIVVDGQELSIRGAGFQELRLKPGRYDVAGTKDGKIVSRQLVTVTRAGKQVVKVTQEPPVPAAVTDPDRRAALAVKALGPVRLEIADANGNTHVVEPGRPLPAWPFRLLTVGFLGDEFDAQGDGFADAAAAALGDVRLTGAYMPDRLTAAGLAKVVRRPPFAGMKYLNMTGPGPDDGCFAHVAALPKLVTLDMGACPRVTGRGVAALAACPGLTDICLSYSAMTAAGIADLRRLPRLTFLNLDHVRLTPDHAAALAGLPLKTLFVSRTGLDDALLARLAGIATLERLAVASNPVTDAGLARLGTLAALTRLDVSETRVTAAGVAALKAKLPKCEIVSTP